MRRFTWLAIAVALLAGGAFAYQWFVLEPEVKTTNARRGRAAEVVYATGVVEPRRWAKVISPQRKRIVELCDCEGKAVKQGDVLGRLEDVEERAQLAELEARAKRIELDTLRIKGLVERQAATQTSYDQSLTQLQEYQARIVAQKDRISDLVLRAPMDGIVLRRDGEVGELAGTGVNDVLFWVGQDKPLRVVAEVNEEDAPRVRVGQKVLLRSEGFSGAQLSAEVASVTPKGDPVAKTFRVYLALPEASPLRIGMSVEANIVAREVENALLVPLEAIADGAVWRLEGGALRKTPVKTGLRGVRDAEITEGLAEGSEIAIPARPEWRDGARARRTGAPR